MPSNKIISKAVSSIVPLLTRYAPNTSATAAPTAIALSVIPRASEFVAKTHIVLRKSSLAFSASKRARAPLWPKDFNVARPWIESKNSAANSAYARSRSRDLRVSNRCQAAGANRAMTAAASSTPATGKSTKTTKPKITKGVKPATNNCGKYLPK